jgi:hypothetical protein
MGKFGRERVERELQWSVVSRNLVAAYDYLLAPRAVAQKTAPSRIS